MPRAIWNGVVVAKSDTCEVVDGTVYFPQEAIKKEYFTESNTTSVCPRKGTAHYYDLDVKGRVNRDAAWTYRHPGPFFENIKDYVAFWKGVEIEK